jgi:hypothetical protein
LSIGGMPPKSTIGINTVVGDVDTDGADD